jgi:hypothetical protein
MELFSLSEVAKRLGVMPYRNAYLHTTGKLPEPVRFLGKRAYSEADIRVIASHFGIETGEEPDKGDEC